MSTRSSSEPDDPLYEIRQGGRSVRPRINFWLSQVDSDLLARLKGPFERRSGSFFLERTGYRIFADDPTRVRFCHISYIKPGRLSGDEAAREYLEIAPDLVVDILTPLEHRVDAEPRLRDFLDAGARLAWLVDTTARDVTVYRRGTPALRLGPDDVLDGGEILPNYSCPVSEIFDSL